MNTFPEIQEANEEDKTEDDTNNQPSGEFGKRLGEPREIVAGPKIGDVKLSNSAPQIFWNRNISKNKPLFYVKGANHTSYLKTSVGIQYDGNNWFMRNQTFTNYSGEVYLPDVNEYSSVKSDRITIEPAINFTEGFIPVSTYTVSINDGPIYSNTFLNYFDDLNIYYSSKNFSCPYSFYTIHYEYSEKQLNSANVINDSKYYQLPDEISSRVKKLADSITEGFNTPYKKVQRIQNYLNSNYEFEDVSIPSDTELVDWFLFESKSGNSFLFSSAFTVLARAAGIPSRLVRGYKISQLEGRQTVVPGQNYYWSEVNLDIGWIEVDLKERSDASKLESETKIDYISSDKIYKRDTVTVAGSVSYDDSDRPVDGMEVLIYLKENKNFDNSGIIIGDGITDDGSFNITCYIPDQIDVGSYHLMARAVENDELAGSWSDPPVEVLSKTKIETNLKNKYCYNTTIDIKGRLIETSGEPLINRTISLFLDNTLIDSVNTDDNGSFIFKRHIDIPGYFTVRLQYNGSEYYSNSSITKGVNVESAIITSNVDDYYVRGEKCQVGGALMVDDVGVAYKQVNMTIEYGANNIRVTEYTDKDGKFRHNFNISDNIEPSLMTIKYEFSNNNQKKIEEVLIKADTELNTDFSKEVKEGNKIKLHLSLVLDNGTRIKNQQLKIESLNKNSIYNMSTDDNGEVNLTIEVPREYNSEKYNISISYHGTDLYDKCSSNISIDVIQDKTMIENFSEFISSNRYLLYFLIPLIVGISLIGYASRRGYLNELYRLLLSSNIISKKENVQKSEVVKDTPPYNVDIIFPQIIEGLPEVWGIDEELKIVFKSRTNPNKINRLRLKINDKIITTVMDPSSSNFSYSKIFNSEGKQKIAFIIDIDGTVIKEIKSIRIVNYRDEIQKVYTNFLESVRQAGIEVKQKTTPMELENKINDLLDNPSEIRTITRIFEKAKYGYHEIDRDDYEKIFLAKQKLEGNIAG